MKSFSRKGSCLIFAILLMLGSFTPALAATVGESGGVPGGAGIAYEPGVIPGGRTARAALFSAGTETEAITVSLNNNDPDRIAGFTVSAVPADGGEPLYGVRQGESWSYQLPFSSPPQEDQDFTISVTSQGNKPGFYQSAVKETVMTYNAIKSLVIRNGDADATGKTLYLQTSNAEGKQSVQLTVQKKGSSSSSGSTGHPYMKANDYAEAVVWQSSNESVATVDDTGLVTAHTGGTAAETQFTLSAALTGGLASDELEWVNSNPSAAAMTVAADGRSATVSASGKTAGRTTIMVHVKGAPDTGSYKASCAVNVVTISSLTVSPASATLYTQGEPKTVQLSATISPNAAPVWTSSNPAVATVNGTGLVTAAAVGSATVTATVGGRSASSAITVQNKIPVTSVTVSGTNSLVRTSDRTTVTTQLSATVKPDNATFKTVTWAKTGGSGNININANGLVTATAAGSATFTATADGVSSAAYTVTVSDQAPTGITISGSSAQVKVGATTTLSAAVSPANALNTNVSWSSSNPAVATVSPASSASGAAVTVTGVAAGTATITATAAGNTGKSASCTVTVMADPPVDDNGVIMVEGNGIVWAGYAWWVIDSDGSQYGGKPGSVVLLARFKVPTGNSFDTTYFEPGSPPLTYKGSKAESLCQKFYDSLPSPQKEKLSPHKSLAEAGINTRVWLPSAYELLGSSRPVEYQDTFTEIKQFSCLANKNASLTNTQPFVTLLSQNSTFLRSPYSTSPKEAAVFGLINGKIKLTHTGSTWGMYPCVILNP